MSLRSTVVSTLKYFSLINMSTRFITALKEILYVSYLSRSCLERSEVLFSLFYTCQRRKIQTSLFSSIYVRFCICTLCVHQINELESILYKLQIMSVKLCFVFENLSFFCYILKLWKMTVYHFYKSL